jgi:hypothetical protein
MPPSLCVADWRRVGALAGRPRHLSAAEHVHVQVVDTLAAVGAIVNHGAEAIAETEIGRDLARSDQQVTENGGVAVGRGREL